MEKKIIVPTIVAVATLVLLVFGATYAYFTVGSTNRFGTKELNASLEDMADAVVIEQVENELSLNVTRAMMSQDNAGTRYYASGSSVPANIAKISTSGEGTFTCYYTIEVTKSASSEENDLQKALIDSNLGAGNVYLYIHDGFGYDLFYHKFPIKYGGTIYGITKDNPQYITTNLLLLNRNSNQNALKGKDITLSYSISNFECELEKPAPIFAIYDQSEKALVFYQNRDLEFYYENGERVYDGGVVPGEEYDGYTVDALYTDLNNTNYTSVDDVPWHSINNSTIIFKDVVSPTNTAYWFAGLDTYEYDLINLDTSKVTNMSHMFEGASWEFGMTADLSSWDTSKVTDMSYMFYGVGDDSRFDVELSNWDTSNVTDMSYMFYTVGNNWLHIDLSNWDTSNVTNMSNMFAGAGMNADQWTIGNITRREVTANGKTYIAWDTSKVTNMESMFEMAGVETTYTLDLTSWQVPLVTNYAYFNEGVESKITPPTWVN